VPRILEIGRVDALRQLSGGYFTITLRLPKISACARPSEFIMLSVRPPGDPGWDPLLPRPFTFLRVRPPDVEILARVVGRGTALLASTKTGTLLQALGPLGQGFQAPASPETQALFVAGGVGVAPFLHFAETLKQGQRPVLLYGGRTRADIQLVDDFEAANMKVELATEDGSFGTKGRVTVLLEKWVATRKNLHVYACGPTAMMEAVAKMCRGIPCQVSLEANMGCGIGICRGCAVPLANGGYAEICVDGPVRDATEIWG
jgi:dihydroorotate dehydrogenase electron transfer subunit